METVFEPGDRIYCTVCKRHGTVLSPEDWHSERTDSYKGSVEYLKDTAKKSVLFRVDEKWGGRFLWTTTKDKVNLISKGIKEEESGQLLMF